MKTVVSKPNALGEKRRWIRLSELIVDYPIKESTVHNWKKTGKIKRWKKVSPKMTIFDREELEELFNPNIDIDSSIEKVQQIVSPTKKRRKRIKIKKEVSSHDGQINASTKKKKIRRRTKIARNKEFNAHIVMPKPKQYKPFAKNKEGIVKGLKSCKK